MCVCVYIYFLKAVCEPKSLKTNVKWIHLFLDPPIMILSLHQSASTITESAFTDRLRGFITDHPGACV